MTAIVITHDSIRNLFRKAKSRPILRQNRYLDPVSVVIVQADPAVFCGNWGSWRWQGQQVYFAHEVSRKGW